MKNSTCSTQGKPKAMPKGRKVSQTTKAPKIASMAGFAKFGRVGGTVKAGKDRT